MSISMGIKNTVLCILLLYSFIFLFFPGGADSFTLYEEGNSPEMTYCSYYARTQLQSLTTLPAITETDIEQGILQGNAIVLLEKLLNDNLLVSVGTSSLSQIISNPEPYTLLDFYVYTPHASDTLSRLDYQLQGHRAVLLYLHDLWRIYDPVKLAYPYRQTAEQYFLEQITPDMYPYVYHRSYLVAEQMRDHVDAFFDLSISPASTTQPRQKQFSQYQFDITYDASGLPISYRAKNDLIIAGNDDIALFVGSGTSILAADKSPFSIDLLQFHPRDGLSFPSKTLLFSKPILFLDAHQEAYALSSFTTAACTHQGVVVFPHTGTVSLGVCRSDLFGW